MKKIGNFLPFKPSKFRRTLRVFRNAVFKYKSISDILTKQQGALK